MKTSGFEERRNPTYLTGMFNAGRTWPQIVGPLPSQREGEKKIREIWPVEFKVSHPTNSVCSIARFFSLRAPPETAGSRHAISRQQGCGRRLKALRACIPL